MRHSVVLSDSVIFPMHCMLCVMLACTAMPGIAQAKVYKCTDKQNKTVYADQPCSDGSRQTLTDISAVPAQEKLGDQAATQKSSLTRQMDDAVKLAISNDDLVRAQALASTPEQKNWVLAAKKEQAKLLASNNSRQRDEKSNSPACLQAKRELEKESRASFPDSAVLSLKTSLAQQACDSSAPVAQPYYPRYSPYLFQPYPYGQYPQQYAPHSPHAHSSMPASPGQPGTGPNNPAPHDHSSEPPSGKHYIRTPTR